MKQVLALLAIVTGISSMGQGWDNSTAGQITYTGGNVGIGTNSPSGTGLNIVGAGTIAFDGHLSNAWTLVGSATNGLGFDSNQISQAGDHLYLTAFDGDIRFYTGVTPKMTIHNNGYVGVGRSPLSFFDLYGGPSGDVVLTLEADSDNAGSEADNPRIEMYQDNKLIGAAIGFNEDVPTPRNIFQIGMTSPDGIIPYALTIDPYSGFVGLGTVDPKSRLSVEGQVRATEVKVLTDIGVPDYVFEPDYNLTSLQEIEAYIRENKHLLEIPSAAEVEADGLKLAEMNLLLLKKIEELTLYTIEQEKEIEKLEVRSQKLEGENSKFRIHHSALQERLEAQSSQLETQHSQLETLAQQLSELQQEIQSNHSNQSNQSKKSNQSK